MGLITAHGVSLRYGERLLFDKVGLMISPGERIGLIGRNGSGKTTLLRLIRGDIPPDEGTVNRAKGARIGYLPQDVGETSQEALLTRVTGAVPGLRDLQERRKTLDRALSLGPGKDEQTQLARELAEVHESLETLERDFPSHRARKILHGLGFRNSDFDRPVASLSGGWKTRAALAGLLHQDPDLLLLDEPTNHLDVPSIHWLEQFLKDCRGAAVIVSHDREFLNRQVDRILSLEAEGTRSYKGNYDAYLKARHEEMKTLEARERNREQRVREAKKFIDRFRAKATKARQAQSKLKLVEKMEMVKTHRTEKTVHFSFPQVPRSGREVVSIQGLTKAYGESPLYEDLDLHILRGERIALIGPNGSGKTTLLKIIAGETRPDRGTVALGHGVSLAYFAQHHSEILDPRNTVLQEVHRTVPDAAIGFVRSVCGAFLFQGDDVDKAVGLLSGGERARVSLAKLLVKPGNLMVMDEPTNHLDIASSESLIDALCHYEGTLIFVSHNRSFINRLATKIWDIRDGEIEVYPGTLDEYDARLEGMEGPAAEQRGVNPPAADPSGRSNRGGSGGGPGPGAASPRGGGEHTRSERKAAKRRQAERRRRIHETLKPIREGLERTETRIALLESRQKALEKSLADPDIFKDESRSVPMLDEYKNLGRELETLLERWESQQRELETTMKDLEVSA